MTSLFEPKSYLDYVLDYFLVLTAICTVFTCCACTLYSLYMGGMRHIFRFVALNLVFCLVINNIAAIPRMLLTNDILKCEIAAIVDHYFWISQNCWLCSLAFESFKNMPVITPCTDFRRRAVLHAILCYVSPTILLSVTAVAHYSQAYWLGYLYGSRFCSLSNVGLFIFASIMPTALTLILSIFFLLVAIYRFQPAKQADTQLRNSSFSFEIEKTRKWLITSLMFIFVAGICWCIHLFYSVLRVTLAFYFSIFLDQLRTTLISLLLMYNVRSERSLDRKIFWEKVRISTSSRLSMHSFHTTTPIRKLYQPTNTVECISAANTLYPRPLQSPPPPQHQQPNHQLYNTGCKSMYEFGYNTSPHRVSHYRISPPLKPRAHPAIVGTMSNQGRNLASKHLGSLYTGGVSSSNQSSSTMSSALANSESTASHQAIKSYNFPDCPTTIVKSSTSARNLNNFSNTMTTKPMRSETSSALVDITKFSTLKPMKKPNCNDEISAITTPISTSHSVSLSRKRASNYVELPPLKT